MGRGRDGDAPAIVIWRFGEPVAPLAEVVRGGGVLAIPTESSYGLAVDPLNREAVESVYRLKGRARGEPLPVVVADRGRLAGLGIDPADPILRTLGDLWPGPLSLVLPLARPLPAAAGGDTLAVRVPGHAPLRHLLDELATPLTATSANRSGAPPLLEPAAARALLAAAPAGALSSAAVIDGGTLPGGPPSTLVRGLPGGGWEILRQGAVAAGRIAAAMRQAAGGETATGETADEIGGPPVHRQRSEDV